MDNEPEITLTDDELALYDDIKGQMVNDIKTFSGGSKNDYNYVGA